MNNKDENVLKRRKLYRAGILAFMVFITCFTFPMFNFIKTYSKSILIVNLLLVPTASYRIGEDEAKVFAEYPVYKVLLLNLAAIGVGLFCRYLLEFGEVSNTYNFVLPNIAFHVTVALTISTFMFWLQKNRKRQR